MKIIKNTLLFLFFAVAFGYTTYSFYSFSLSPCEKPLEYSIGIFDTQFGVSKEEFRSYIASAETVWEKELGRDIFSYDPDAEFKINLIYDQRQISTIQKQKTEFGLSAIEEVFKKLDLEFSIFKNRYDQKIASHESALASFEERKSAYDREVALWNKKGGAPKEKYESLEEERQYLNSEAARLNAETSDINIMSKELEVLLRERNVKAAEYNKVAENYNAKYDRGLEFNQAEYTSKEINVYQFSNKNDLVLALSHELGHALGMGHVENPMSIMYYITGSNTKLPLEPSDEDLSELNRVCKM